MSSEAIPNQIIEEHSFTFVNHLVNKFYVFMADVYIEYQNLKIKEHQDLLAEKSGDVKVLQPFPQYFLYKLYYNYGIKRRMSNDYIALLYYSKTAKGYKSTEPITMLCRHMLIDLRFMRIVSLGIPKAVKLDAFCETYSIDKTNQETNYSVINNTDTNTETKNEKYRLYYFSEGTMMTYNPSLKKYNITIVNTESDDEYEEDEDNTDTNTDTKMTNLENKLPEKIDLDLDLDLDLDKNIEIKFNNQFMYSTRKVLGTGSFGSNKSFLEMFEENNNVYNTKLDDIPSALIKDTVLVFNIEHPENNIISTIKRNTNTLCAVFRFKTEETSQYEFSNIISKQYIPDMIPDIITDIYDGFKKLGTNMVTQIQVSNYKKYLNDHNVNVNFYLPKIVKSFEKVISVTEVLPAMTVDEMPNHITTQTKEQINVNTISISQLETMVNNKSKYFHGYILYGVNGERTKITNKKYKDLCELKGNKPITLDKSNIKNLFYLYLRLVKDKNVNKFIKEFDTDKSDLIITYKKMFLWFYSLIHNYSMNLFKVYHYSFVKKTFNKPDIPFSLKPLCGDLHKLYKTNNTPITNTIVEQYLFELASSKLFWRLFQNETDTIPIFQNTLPVNEISITNSETTVDTN